MVFTTGHGKLTLRYQIKSALLRIHCMILTPSKQEWRVARCIAADHVHGSLGAGTLDDAFGPLRPHTWHRLGLVERLLAVDVFVDTVNEGEAAAQLAATLDEMYGAELFFIGVAPVGQSAQIRRAVVYCGRRIQRTVQHTVNQWMQNGAKETFCAKLSLHA